MENKYSLIISELAFEDLDGYLKYISENLSNPQAAKNLMNEFKSAFEIIRLFPLSCPLLNNELIKEQSLRKLIVKNFIALYVVEGNSVKIVRIIHMTKDYPSII